MDTPSRNEQLLQPRRSPKEWLISALKILQSTTLHAIAIVVLALFVFVPPLNHLVRSDLVVHGDFQITTDGDRKTPQITLYSSGEAEFRGGVRAHPELQELKLGAIGDIARTLQDLKSAQLHVYTDDILVILDPRKRDELPNLSWSKYANRILHFEGSKEKQQTLALPVQVRGDPRAVWFLPLSAIPNSPQQLGNFLVHIDPNDAKLKVTAEPGVNKGQVEIRVVVLYAIAGKE